MKSEPEEDRRRICSHLPDIDLALLRNYETGYQAGVRACIEDVEYMEPNRILLETLRALLPAEEKEVRE